MCRALAVSQMRWRLSEQLTVQVRVGSYAHVQRQRLDHASTVEHDIPLFPLTQVQQDAEHLHTVAALRTTRTQHGRPWA